MSKNNYVEPFKGKDGYMYVTLVKDGIEHVHPVHMLVWETFKGKVPEGYVVKHKNGNKSDNSLENLVLVNKEEYDDFERRMEEYKSLDDITKKIVKPILIHRKMELGLI